MKIQSALNYFFEKKGNELKSLDCKLENCRTSLEFLQYCENLEALNLSVLKFDDEHHIIFAIFKSLKVLKLDDCRRFSREQMVWFGLSEQFYMKSFTALNLDTLVELCVPLPKAGIMKIIEFGGLPQLCLYEDVASKIYD